VSGAYTPFGWVRLAWEAALTRLFQANARLIRRPFYLRGARHIDFGKRITIGRGARIEAYGIDDEINIVFGDDVQLNDHVHIAGAQKVTIGNRVLIASRVFITDHNHGTYGADVATVRPSGRNGLDGSDWQHSGPDIPPAQRPLAMSPVEICDDVWLGQGVCVMPGVTIGAGSVIGANAVVTRDIPARSVAVGAPARVVRVYDPDMGWIPQG